MFYDFVTKYTEIFSTKNIGTFRYKHLKFYETLTNEVVSFEEPDPGWY